MKRIALAIGAGIVATGAVVASAASLGNLNVNSLGTSSSVVASCASGDIALEWNTTDPVYSGSGTVGNSTYTTQTVKVTGPEACGGAKVRVTAAKSDGTALGGQAEGVLSTGTTPNVTMTFVSAFNSKDADQTTVTVYNDTTP